MRKKIFIIIFSSILWTETYSQEKFGSIPIAPEKIKAMKALMMGDSIFIMINYYMEYKAGLKAFMVPSNSDIMEVKLDMFDYGSIFSVTQTPNGLHIYFLEEKKKEVSLKVSFYDFSTKKIETLPGELKFQGRLFGQYQESGKLFILTAPTKGFTASLIKLNGLKIESQINFKIPFELGSNQKSQVSFRGDDVPSLPISSCEPIKITKADNLFWITVDEHKDPYQTEVPPGKLFKTSVIKLDINNPDSTQVKTFFSSTNAEFRSHFYKEYLIRSFADQDLNFELFDFSSGKQILSLKIPRKTKTDKTDIYQRIGSKNSVTKTVGDIPFNILNKFIYIESISEDQTLTLSTGSNWQDQSSSPLLYAFGPATFFASFFVQAMVRELSQRGNNYAYYYVDLKLDGTYKIANNNRSLMKQVDDYELSEFLKKRPFYKGYLPAKNKLFAFYGLKGQSGVQILKFEKQSNH